MLKRAIDRGLIARSEPLSKALVILGVLAVLRGVLTYYFRASLYQRGDELEEDLRTTMYEHLSGMSFSFYDRVQSGQLISRANSDIRSVQMYLAFAPIDPRAVQRGGLAFVLMLTINVPLAFVAMATMPFVYIVGVRMRKRMFPVSWLIQARLADVATVVDENINGVRVVKSFAAEERQLSTLHRAAPSACGGRTSSDADIRARWAPLIENLPRARAGAGAALRRLPRDQRPGHASATSSPSTPTS